MHSIRRLTATVAAGIAGGCALLAPGVGAPREVGVDVDATATVTFVEGTATLQWSRMVEGAVWRLDARDEASSASLAGEVLDQLEAAACEVVDSLHGHGVNQDGELETTITAVHVRCADHDVEVGWSTGRATVWVVIGEA